MARLNLVVNSTRSLDLGASRSKTAMRKVVNHLTGLLSGANPADGWLVQNDTGATCRSVAGMLFATGTGTVGSVINGTSVTVTWGTSDTATAAALVAAINANSTANPLVMATRYYAKATCATIVVGDTVNVCGYLFTAATTGGGAGTFTFTGGVSNSADAAALALAINLAPGLNMKVSAVSDGTSAVYIFIAEDRAARSDERLRSLSSTITCVDFAAGAAYGIIARQPGLIANACTCTATGTNLTAFSLVSGKLGGGRGGWLSTGQYLTQDTK